MVIILFFHTFAEKLTTRTTIMNKKLFGALVLSWMEQTHGILSKTIAKQFKGEYFNSPLPK